MFIYSNELADLTKVMENQKFLPDHSYSYYSKSMGGVYLNGRSDGRVLEIIRVEYALRNMSITGHWSNDHRLQSPVALRVV